MTDEEHEGKRVALMEKFEEVLGILGLDPKINPDTADTPRRYADSMLELLRGSTLGETIADIMSKTSPAEGYDEMIVSGGIDATGICPHHILPIEYNVVVGYIPSDGVCLGLSKFARLIELLAARAVLQEQLTMDIVASMITYLKPVGAGVIVRGVHGCMTCRGVKQRNSFTVTTSLYGPMKTDPKCREEFLFHSRTK